MEENSEFIILVNSKRVIGEKLLKEASQSFVKIGKDELSFLEERILLDMASWKSCVEKEGDGEFLYNKLEREPHFDLENEADFMESMRKEECLE